MTEKIRAWHFLGESRRLAYGDGRLVEVGVPLECRGRGRPRLCTNGMHASVWISDALRYARGPVLCLVDVWGDTQEEDDDDKLCGRFREVVEMHDVTQELHLLACAVATFALENKLSCGRYVDPRSFAAVEAKRGWLAGTVSAAELRAAALKASQAEGRAALAAEVASSAWAESAAWAARELAATSPTVWEAIEGFALDIVGAKFEHINDEVTS